MTDPRTGIFEAIRNAKPDRVLMNDDVVNINALLDRLKVPRATLHMAATPGGVMAAATAPAQGQIASPGLAGAAAAVTDSGGLTARICMELVGHEAIVQEAYKDSVGVWTWGVGVTNNSGHAVDRYKDNPQPIRKCLEIYIWLLRMNYLPDVLQAFTGRQLTEAQLGAALSFHYNTGAIKTASWVRSFMAGRPTEARQQIMNWTKPASLTERRTKERDLFFDGKWTADGKATVYPVRKPSYSPDWRHPQRVDIRADVEALL
jgi:lysozyme